MTWGLVERILKHAALTRRRARSPTQGLADDGGAGSSCVGVDHGGGAGSWTAALNGRHVPPGVVCAAKDP